MDYVGWQPRWAKLRASDSDRDQVASQLREHCAAGRLTVDELTERLDQVFRAKTLGDLSSVVHDLPDLQGRPVPWVRPTIWTNPAPQRRSRRSIVLPIVLVVLLLSALAHPMMATGAGVGVAWVLVLVAFMCARRLLWSAHRTPRGR